MKTPVNHTKSDYPFGMVMPGRSVSLGGYRFGFNGKENDNEVKGVGNSVDFGARIYDSRLGRWLSLDPLQKKYPSMSPFIFTANSPIMFRDVDGRDLDIGGDTKKAVADLRSILPEKYRPFLFVTDKNEVQFDVSIFSKEELENDAGATLINDLVSSKYKYLYEVKEDNNGKPLSSANNTIENNSVTARDELTPNSQDKLPKDYQGQVIIHPDAEFNQVEGEENKSSVVYHELQENYERTNNKLPYLYRDPKDKSKEDPVRKGAHKIAVDKAKNLSNEAKSNYGKEGQVDKPKIGK